MIRTSLSCALATTLLLGSLGAQASLELPALRLDQLEAWREHLRPTAEELAYEQIDWIPVLGDALLAAHETDKPLLFWAMNGHPLACT